MNRVADDIRFVPHESIDMLRWDRCIDAAGNGCLYAESFFLNAMAGQWHALIYKDYEAVMPLTHGKKWGIRYLYQPAFTQQGGIFSTGLLSKTLIARFISACQSHYRFAEIHLNSGNAVSGLVARNNFVLSLRPSYENIRSGYKHELVHNLKKAGRSGLQYEATGDYQTAISLYEQQYGKRFPDTRSSDYHHFRQCAAAAEALNRLLVRKVSLASGELLSVAIFMRSGRSIYNLMPVTLPAGREKNANHYLLDQLIREFAGQSLILDFEGSEIPGIADFYQKFGSVNQPYFFLRYNRLPFPFNLMKGQEKTFSRDGATDAQRRHGN